MGGCVRTTIFRVVVARCVCIDVDVQPRIATRKLQNGSSAIVEERASRPSSRVDDRRRGVRLASSEKSSCIGLWLHLVGDPIAASKDVCKAMLRACLDAVLQNGTNNQDPNPTHLIYMKANSDTRVLEQLPRV